MAHKTIYKVKRRRRREGKTKDEKRFSMLKSDKIRFVIRNLNNMTVCQLIEYNQNGDKTIVNTTSLELKKYGYKGHNGNIPASYLTGYLCGKKAVDKKITEAVADIGLRTPVHNSNVFAAIKGAVDSGLQIPFSEEAFSSVEKLKDADVVKKEIDKGVKKTEKKERTKTNAPAKKTETSSVKKPAVVKEKK